MKNFRKAILGIGLGVVTLVGVNSVSAQRVITNEEYREWQQAQRRADDAYRDYQRTRTQRDYRDWQQAMRTAKQEQRDYQQSIRRNRNTWNNNGNWNNNRGRYRVNRGGRYYETDQRGIEMLRQAVNRGYQQGYSAGARDKRYNRGVGYYSNDSIYRSGTYGYQSHVSRDQYQYYFQQGFQRGYQDGYENTRRYGSRNGTQWNVLGNVLNSILQFSQD